MPFVRIDLMRGKTVGYRKALGEIVYQAMIDLIDVPKDDKFQIITEHAPEELNFPASYLGNRYSQDIVFIQITLNAGTLGRAKEGLLQAHRR
jgi:4-oxalocrotonate tautomerase